MRQSTINRCKDAILLRYFYVYEQFNTIAYTCIVVHPLLQVQYS